MSERRLRSTRPDVDEPQHEYYALLKNVSYLRLTYQLKLLGFLSVKNERFLFLKVPKSCELSPKLLAWIDSIPPFDEQQRIRIQRY